MSPRRGPVKCTDCQARVVWAFSPFTSHRRMFDARPVDPATHQGPPAFPVEGGTRAWKPWELIADLQARRECSAGDAEAEVHDMPWHVFHECPNAPYRPAEERT